MLSALLQNTILQLISIRNMACGFMLFTAMMPLALCQYSQSNHINESILNEEWRWVQFTTESGLPSNHVTALVESNDGIIWVATTSGIAWFDGYRWNALDSS
jgi:hypothetical protein